MSINMTKFLSMLLLVCSCISGFSVNYYPKGNGSFESTTTWQGATVGTPGAADNITFTYSGYTIPASNSITLSSNRTISNIDFSNCSTTQITFSSADGLDHTLTINNLLVESDFTLIVQNHITLVVNGTTTTNGGIIKVETGGAINFKSNVTLAGAGADLYVAAGATMDVVGTLNFSGGANQLYITGTLSMDNMSASGGQQELNILAGGNVIVRSDASFSGSAGFTINNSGEFLVQNNMTVSGGASGVINGSLEVTNTLTNSRALTGTGTVYAGTYAGTGSIFGTGMTSLIGGNTYQQSGGVAVVVVPTPIMLDYFNVYCQNNAIAIDWQTASELNNRYFTLERSADGIDFETLAIVSGGGTSSIAHNYRYTDDNPINGVSYYRLKQTDFNGDFKVFVPVSVSFLNEDNLEVGPNPATTEFHISLAGEMGMGVDNLYSFTGTLVHASDLNSNLTTINVSNLPKGNYLLVVIAGESIISKKVVVN
jgi:hypothetical protein